MPYPYTPPRPDPAARPPAPVGHGHGKFSWRIRIARTDDAARYLVAGLLMVLAGLLYVFTHPIGG